MIDGIGSSGPTDRWGTVKQVNIEEDSVARVRANTRGNLRSAEAATG